MNKRELDKAILELPLSEMYMFKVFENEDTEINLNLFKINNFSFCYYFDIDKFKHSLIGNTHKQYTTIPKIGYLKNIEEEYKELIDVYKAENTKYNKKKRNK